MATIRKNGNNWQAIVRRKGFKQQSKCFPFKRDAEAWAKVIESEQIRGTFVDTTLASTTTFLDALDRYEEEQAAQGRRSIRQLKSQLKLLRASDLAKISILNIKPADINSFKRERMARGIKQATYTKDHNLLHRLFEVIQKDWGIELPRGNPVKRVFKPKNTYIEGRERRLEKLEEELLLNDLEQRSHETAMAVRLALETGMRRGELLKIRFNHIDTEKQCLVIPETKTDRKRVIPLTDKAFELIDKRIRTILHDLYDMEIDGIHRRVTDKAGYRESLQNEEQWSKELLFRMKPDSLTQAFSRACHKQGIENLTFHDLRHEAISRLFEAGLDMMEVAHISGHKSFDMLKRYTHLKPEHILAKLKSS